jgi:hypothetical protein
MRFEISTRQIVLFQPVASALLRRLGTSAGNDPGFVLEVQDGQPDPVQQHDLPLGMAEEGEHTLAVEI